MLRDYQQEAVRLFEESDKKNILLQLPTGAGKTFTFCKIAKNFVIETNQRVVIIVHREELMQQAKKSLGDRCFLISAGVKIIPDTYDYYIAMVETMSRRLDKLPSFGLVIIDECHIGNFKKLPFFKDENIRVLGVTATPITHKTDPLSNYYQDIIIPVTIGKLINDGYLLNCDVYAFGIDDVRQQNWRTKGGDYDEKQMQDFYSSEKLVNTLIDTYWKLIKGKKTLIFNVNISHNDDVYDALISEGLNAYRLDGSTPKEERKLILENFKNERDAILCNVGVLTTGFDEPSLEVVVLNRATKSLSLYLQMIGRGARTHENKEKFTVIDLGLNTERHGFYVENFDWESKFNFKKEHVQGAAPMKICGCGMMLHISVRECPNCCFEFKSKEQEEKERKLQELTLSGALNINYKEILEYCHERGYKPYSGLFKIANAIAKIEARFPDFFDKDKAIEKGLEEWAKFNKNRKTEWNRSLLKEQVEKAKVSSSKA